ncbi:hypothetical protein D1BOALGB6SA_2714 [Olavius sp. associated proteobacterium Delta 1]|nr:hypothetical protein D1BOALGB6SA_2714 [Olavius sp. associated proteobacterium Delta 1]
MDYSIGFNGHFKLNSWTPLSVVLDNRGRATTGNLEVIVTSGSEYQGDVYRTIYTTEVDLPQNSKKRYALTILIKSFSHDLIIRLRQDKDLIFARSINLRPHFTEKKLAVVADNFVAPDILSVLPNHLYPVNVRPKSLPETWYGYDSVKLLILQADTIRQLRDKQFQALSRWLKQGGYLVVGTGLNYGSLGDKRLQEILPLHIAGHQQLSELTSLGQFCGRKLTGNQPFLVLTARIDDSKILLKENDIPIITRKNLELGQIIFLSFNFNAPPFSRWDGRRIFWNKILSLPPEIDRPMIEVADQQIVNSMLAGIPLEFPDYRSVVVYVAAYLFFLWFLLKQIKKPGKGRWQFSLYLVLLIAFFTSIGYWGFYRPNLKQKFSFNSFYQLDIADPNAPATAKYVIGLYSLKKLDYGLNFGSYTAPITHIVPEKSDIKIPAPYVLQKKDSGQHIIGSIKRWSHNFYKLNLHVTSPLAGYARSDKSFMTLMVENKLPHDLVDCLIYYRKRFLFVADILAGNRQTMKVDLAKLKKKEAFGEHAADAIVRRLVGNGSAAYLRKTQRLLTPELLLEIHNKYKSRSDSMILIGWVQAGLILPQFNQDRPPGAGITMINWKLPVEIIL